MGQAYPCTKYAIQQRYVAASIELVLEASKRAIPDSIEKLRVHEKLMRNYLDTYERATFSPKGSSEDKPLKAWGDNIISKLGRCTMGNNDMVIMTSLLPIMHLINR